MVPTCTSVCSTTLNSDSHSTFANAVEALAELAQFVITNGRLRLQIARRDRIRHSLQLLNDSQTLELLFTSLS